jgi:photosystem I P700 chlorophyll a apoprotein A1
VFARSSRLIPDKANLGFRFPCDGPGRGGTCQTSAWDHIFLGLSGCTTLYQSLFSTSVGKCNLMWGTVNDAGVSHITGGNFCSKC